LLHTLAIRDLVLIEAVDLELGPGLSVLTGETGAGKSILLDGLGLALGERAEPAMVRRGAAQATAIAAFALPADHPALRLAADEGLAEAGELVLRRTLKADGGSRGHVNDRPVSAAMLRTLGRMLVEVHGQHDERGLLQPRGHLALLDAFAGHRALLAAVAEAWGALVAARAAREAAESRAEADAQDRAWLAHAVDELRTLEPIPGEEATLAGRRSDMQRGARLADGLDLVDALVSDADGALSKLRQAARRLERLADGAPELAAALEAVDRALVEGDAVETALRAARQRYTVAPDALEAAEARLFDLRAAARKHRVEPDALAGLGEELEARLAALDSGAEALAGLAAAEARARDAVAAAAAALSQSRRAAAVRLDAAVNAELPALRLEAARFRTAIAPAPLGENGADSVAFEIATNAGQTFGPLSRIASGGELSRFVLALKVALAATGTAATLVFDEIDRGVGGATASAIGVRLAAVATAAQVLVVTHSPQVAAAGDAHVRIAKAGGRTSVARLDAAERAEEIARMLSGADVTGEARAQAARLLERSG
jgi:DNA repair protein RecN (Recombination protein N)